MSAIIADKSHNLTSHRYRIVNKVRKKVDIQGVHSGRWKRLGSGVRGELFWGGGGVVHSWAHCPAPDGNENK